MSRSLWDISAILKKKEYDSGGLSYENIFYVSPIN